LSFRDKQMGQRRQATAQAPAQPLELVMPGRRRAARPAPGGQNRKDSCFTSIPLHFDVAPEDQSSVVVAELAHEQFHIALPGTQR
jgi:hypothetical protein